MRAPTATASGAARRSRSSASRYCRTPSTAFPAPTSSKGSCKTFRLGVITDEIDPDPERALPVAAELGLRDLELNGLWGRSIVQLSSEELDRLERLLQAGGFRVCAVSTPALKALPVEELAPDAGGSPTPEAEAHLEQIRAGCRIAARFGAPLVRIFSFRKAGMVGLGNPSPRLRHGGEIPAAVLERIAAGLRLAAQIAGEFPVTLVVENVRSCWGNSCRNTARILEAGAGCPSGAKLRMVWDPGNDYVSGGAPFPDGYEAALPWMAHVHVKNASVIDPASGLTRWEPVGDGDLDYRPILARLARDGYDGAVVLETHWRGEGLTAEESTRRCAAELRELLPRG